MHLEEETGGRDSLSHNCLPPCEPTDHVFFTYYVSASYVQYRKAIKRGMRMCYIDETRTMDEAR